MFIFVHLSSSVSEGVLSINFADWRFECLGTKATKKAFVSVFTGTKASHFCGTTLIDTNVPTHSTYEYMRFLDNGWRSRQALLRKTFRPALISPFSQIVTVASHHPATLWKHILRPTLLIQRFRLCPYYIYFFWNCQYPIFKKISNRGYHSSSTPCQRIIEHIIFS